MSFGLSKIRVNQNSTTTSVVEVSVSTSFGLSKIRVNQNAIATVGETTLKAELSDYLKSA